VHELCGSSSVTYRVFDFFVEVLPRKRHLTLVLNIDFEDCDDPTERTVDASQYAFVVRATEKGGVLFDVDDQSHVGPAVHVIRQAYEAVSQ